MMLHLLKQLLFSLRPDLGPLAALVKSLTAYAYELIE
jgi:hypothetical protein